MMTTTAARSPWSEVERSPIADETWLEGELSPHRIADDIARPLENRPTAGWWASLAASVAALALGVGMVTYQIAVGIGVWGLNNAVGWAFDITNFVFWIGIGHAGTLISAILLLFRQSWRTSVNRSAEAMTIFAVMCAAMFPLIHMGRPWLAFWVLPYPNGRGPLWVNFRSPLLWDVFAINTYLIVSAVFWFLGMIPDFALLRDRSSGITRSIYNALSFGWNGSARTWSRYETLTMVLAGLATPLVISVHSIVSMDFATSLLPGWHTTLFPPYFVAGAVFSGFGMVTLLLIIARSAMRLHSYITVKHLDRMACIMLFTGSLVGFSYLTELFAAWYGENLYEQATFVNRLTGPYGWAFWTMFACNVIVPQTLWFRRVRRTPAILAIVALLVNVGMWFERFVIIVTSLHHAYLPSGWAMYKPTVVEVGTLIGSFGLFFTCFLLFIRFLPMIAIWEVSGMAGSHNGAAVLDAVKSARAQGSTVVDVYTPYPVHALDRVLGLPRSRLPLVAFAAGAAGAAGAMGFQVWASAFDWPLDVGGKPLNSALAFVPITFEITILLAALAVTGAFFWRCRLFPGATATRGQTRSMDGFVLALRVPDQSAASRRRRGWRHGVGVLLCLAVWQSGCRGDARVRAYEYMPDMARSVPYDSFAANPVTRNGQTLQTPPPGTIARGFLPLGYQATAADAVRAGQELRSPIAATDETRHEGRRLFETFCAVCHGVNGDGDGPLVPKIPNPPAYSSTAVRMLPAGHLFHVITYGSGRMPSYASQLTREERWKIVAHVQELQLRGSPR